MYSQIPFPPGVRNVRMKEPNKFTDKSWSCIDHSADCIAETTWVVWNRRTGLVDAIFYAEPNTHGWSAAEVHAKSYLNRFSNINPFDYDNIS